MTRAASSRLLAELAAPEIPAKVKAHSILLLPFGSIEQHGPHLPLDTDVVLAEEFSREIIARWGQSYDLWQLPTISIGLAHEHDWAAGSLSVSVATIVSLLRDLAREIARSLPSKNLVVVNGHGGNRGILDALMPELQADFGLNLCALHLGALMSAGNAALPDIHGGQDETSAMLALAPDLVRGERIADLTSQPKAAAVRAAVLYPGVSWPWSSGDPRISDRGVIGDASKASAEGGKEIIKRVTGAAGSVLQQLLDNAAAR